MTTLTIKRNKEHMNAYLAYKVLVNDVQVAEIKAGQEIYLSCISGDRVRLVMTWSSSKEIVIPSSEQGLTIVCGGNLTYNVIGNAGGALFLAIIIGTNLLIGHEVGKKIGLMLAICVMLLVLYMLTIGKSNWIKASIEKSVGD